MTGFCEAVSRRLGLPLLGPKPRREDMIDQHGYFIPALRCYAKAYGISLPEATRRTYVSQRKEA